MKPNWIDRASSVIAPRWTLKRQRARIASELLARNYEAASVGRRTSGWKKVGSDANAAMGPYAKSLRDVARDLVRNNPYAESALGAIANNTVGWGIVAKSENKRAQAIWDAWANSTDCDADGVHDFAGLEKLVVRTVAESGECLVRRRLRKPEDGLPIAMQLQILEPDFLDTLKDVQRLPNGGRIIQGVEFDPIGRRAAYWLFNEHPGATQSISLQSVRVPAENIRHVFLGNRPGQVRAVTWFANALLRFKDLDEYEDATLMKQKIAACLAVITSDPDGESIPLGTSQAAATGSNEIDLLEPGAILNVPPGRSVTTVDPPSVRDYADYTKSNLRGIATGLHVSYEEMTGDYSDVNFSSARMSRLSRYEFVYDWRWRMLIPQFCNPAWNWAMQAAAIGTNGQVGVTGNPTANWTAPPMPMIEPDKEGLAYQRNIRSGIMTQSEAIRERGYDPEEFLKEYADSNRRLDELEIILDSDARKMTQQGLLHNQGTPAVPPAQPTAEEAEEEDRAHRLRLAGGRR